MAPWQSKALESLRALLFVCLGSGVSLPPRWSAVTYPLAWVTKISSELEDVTSAYFYYFSISFSTSRLKTHQGAQWQRVLSRPPCCRFLSGLSQPSLSAPHIPSHPCLVQTTGNWPCPAGAPVFWLDIFNNNIFMSAETILSHWKQDWGENYKLVSLEDLSLENVMIENAGVIRHAGWGVERMLQAEISCVLVICTELMWLTGCECVQRCCATSAAGEPEIPQSADQPDAGGHWRAVQKHCGEFLFDQVLQLRTPYSAARNRKNWFNFKTFNLAIYLHLQYDKICIFKTKSLWIVCLFLFWNLESSASPLLSPA